jgi:hypothetical protein
MDIHEKMNQIPVLYYNQKLLLQSLTCLFDSFRTSFFLKTTKKMRPSSNLHLTDYDLGLQMDETIACICIHLFKIVY